MTDLQMQYLRGQVVDREATIEAQAAEIERLKERLEDMTTHWKIANDSATYHATQLDALANSEPVAIKTAAGITLKAGWDDLLDGTELFAKPQPAAVPEPYTIVAEPLRWGMPSDIVKQDVDNAEHDYPGYRGEADPRSAVPDLYIDEHGHWRAPNGLTITGSMKFVPPKAVPVEFWERLDEYIDAMIDGKVAREALGEINR